MYKICSRCKESKPLSDFSKDRYKKDGYNVSCRVCIKLKPPRIETVKTHKTCKICSTLQPLSNFRGLTCLTCISYRREILKTQKAPRIYSTVTHSVYTRNKRKKDPLTNLRANIGSRIATSLSRFHTQKSTKTLDILGCTIEEFANHIESQFLEGMSWANRSLWHIDHIVPQKLAKTKEELILLSHYTNLRPLWKNANLQKAAKLTEESLAHPLYKIIKSNHGED